MSEKLSIIACGDLCFEDITEKTNYEYSKLVLADLAETLDSADFRLINLENPLTTEENGIKKTGPCLKGDPKNVEFLKAGNFDVAILANNHTGDFGPKGAEETFDILDANGIKYVGAGKNIDDAYKSVILEKNGLTLEVIAAGENEYGGATENAAGMAGFKIGKIFDAIKKARERSDFVLIVFHGGNEFNPLPSPMVKERYHLFLDLGADAVIGMHTHCPQGYEYYNGKPIVYSTGNFWFRSPWGEETPACWFNGYMPKVTFETGKNATLEIHPFILTESGGPLVLLKGDKKVKMLDYIEKLSAIIKNDKELYDHFKGWCMISGPEYASYLDIDIEKFKNGTLEEIGHFYFLFNDFTCEAHNELMKETLRIAHLNEYDFAKQMAEKVRELQKMPI